MLDSALGIRNGQWETFKATLYVQVLKSYVKDPQSKGTQEKSMKSIEWQ